MQPTKTD